MLCFLQSITEINHPFSQFGILIDRIESLSQLMGLILIAESNSKGWDKYIQYHAALDR